MYEVIVMVTKWDVQDNDHECLTVKFKITNYIQPKDKQCFAGFFFPISLIKVIQKEQNYGNQNATILIIFRNGTKTVRFGNVHASGCL